jgi:hypothetical protein
MMFRRSHRIILNWIEHSSRNLGLVSSISTVGFLSDLARHYTSLRLDLPSRILSAFLHLSYRFIQWIKLNSHQQPVRVINISIICSWTGHSSTYCTMKWISTCQKRIHHKCQMKLIITPYIYRWPVHEQMIEMPVNITRYFLSHISANIIWILSYLVFGKPLSSFFSEDRCNWSSWRFPVSTRQITAILSSNFQINYQTSVKFCLVNPIEGDCLSNFRVNFVMVGHMENCASQILWLCCGYQLSTCLNGIDFWVGNVWHFVKFIIIYVGSLRCVFGICKLIQIIQWVIKGCHADRER